MAAVRPQRSKQFESMYQADIEKLDEYLEEMYSDSTEVKVQAARHILTLAQDPECLEYMINHGNLYLENAFGVLARTLRDEFKKSMDLSLYLSTLFFMLSNYSQFHPILLQNQIGDSSIKILEHHIARHDLRRQDLESMKGEQKQKEMEKIEKLEQVQNRLMWLSISTLLNLAEDIQIERKMKKRHVVNLLVILLERSSLSLLEVAVMFLKKLSVFSENKDEMYLEEGIVEKMQRLVPCPHNHNLCQLVLRLIHNLSFDSNIRLQFDSMGYIPRLVSLLKENAYRGITLRILYQLSLEDKCKSTFTYTECIPIVYMLIIQFPAAKVGQELMGLAINLAGNPRNAEIISEGNQLETLITRGLQCEDDLIMKLVRTISKSSKSMHIQETLEKYAMNFINIICSSQDMNFTIELLGTLVNLDLDEQWIDILKQTQLLNFIQRHLVVGYAEDDFVLECVMLVSTIMCHEQCAQLISNTLIIKLLHSLLAEKQEDDEMVQQIIFAFHKMLFYEPTRNIVLNEMSVVNYVMELMHDKNPRIRKMADGVLSVVQEFDQEWREEIKYRRFRQFNQEWLELMENFGEDDYELESDEDEGHQWFDYDDLEGRFWDEYIDQVS